MKTLFLTLAFAFALAAQAPPHQCVYFVHSSDNPAFAVMTPKPVFPTEVVVRCLPQEGVGSYRVEIQSINVAQAPMLNTVDIGVSAAGPQTPTSEWLLFTNLQLPPSFGAVKDVVVSIITFANPRTATRAQ